MSTVGARRMEHILAVRNVLDVGRHCVNPLMPVLGMSCIPSTFDSVR